jgi:hypothetical protein
MSRNIIFAQKVWEVEYLYLAERGDLFIAHVIAHLPHRNFAMNFSQFVPNSFVVYFTMLSVSRTV